MPFPPLLACKHLLFSHLKTLPNHKDLYLRSLLCIAFFDHFHSRTGHYFHIMSRTCLGSDTGRALTVLLLLPDYMLLVGPWARSFWITDHAAVPTRPGGLPTTQWPQWISLSGSLQFLSISSFRARNLMDILLLESLAPQTHLNVIILPPFPQAALPNAMEHFCIHSPNLLIKLESHLWALGYGPYNTPNHHEGLLIWPRTCIFPFLFPLPHFLSVKVHLLWW